MIKHSRFVLYFRWCNQTFALIGLAQLPFKYLAVFETCTIVLSRSVHLFVFFLLMGLEF